MGRQSHKDLNPVSATVWFVLFLKMEPADLLDCETAKVTTLSTRCQVRVFRVAAVLLGLRV